MELSLSTLFFLLIAFAVGAAIIMFMLWQWLDLTGLRYKMESQRNALNLLQLIVSSSPLVQRDPYLEPSKLILDAEKLDEYKDFDMYNQGNFVDDRYIKWSECCVFPDYDYEINVIDVTTDPPDVWVISPIPVFKTEKESECYPKRVISHADMPVVINRNGEYHAGFINMTLTKTPLSDMSSWLSQALVRANWDIYKDEFQQEFEIIVPLDPEIRSGSIDGSGIVCLTFREDDSTKCKSFQTTGAGLDIGNPIDNPSSISCYKVRIVIDPENDRVVVR